MNAGKTLFAQVMEFVPWKASRPGAELALAIALLRAWNASDSEAEPPQSREWLKKICPICLPMIEAMQKVSAAERQCIQ
jgi:hypothetical protein